MKKFLFIALGIFLGIPILGIFVWGFLLSRQKPIYEGVVQIRGIRAPVRIVRDVDGIPHIYAENSKDAFFALGYTVAQDRLFQMDMLRRLSQGRLAEIIGEGVLPIDKMFRTLSLKSWAEEYIRSPKKQNPKAWEFLDAYLSGVNAFIAEGRYPIEYTLIGFHPEEFRAEDTLTSLAYMGFSFAEGLRSDPLYSLLEEKLSGLPVKDLFPRYDFERGAAILENQPSSPRLGSNHPQSQDSRESSKGYRDLSFSSGQSLMRFLRGLDELLGRIPLWEGSNSWILSGKRTESGHSFLVNDPHIGFSNPGTWYEAHLSTPDLNVYGYFLPGSPFPLIGNTDRLAIGLTMLENDDMDLYWETLSEDGTKVLYRNRFVDLKIRSEEIRIRGKKPETFEVKFTPHGPIFSEFVKGYEGSPISLYWVFHHEHSPLLDILYEMLVSQSLSEFRNAVAKISAPGLNVSYIDRDGNIAWFSAGRFLIRGRSSNTRKMLDGGSGKDEVLGFLPFSLNPYLINPPGGIIATANNMPTRREIPGIGIVEGYWQPSDRFRRIIELLSNKERYSLEDMKAMLLDIRLYSAPEIREQMLEAIDWTNPFWQNIPRRDRDFSREAWEILSTWNLENSAESRGATVFAVWCHFIMKNLLESRMGEEEYKIYTSVSDSIHFFKAVMAQHDHPFWDDSSTPEVETREHTIAKSLVDAVRYLRREVSSTPNFWQWKNLAYLEHVHAIGRMKPFHLLFNIGPFPVNGTSETINNMKMNGFLGSFSVRSGPSTRRIVSFQNLDENLSILPIGNSGNLASPFYRDQVEMYRTGKFRNTRVSDAAIRSGKLYELILNP